MCEELRRFSKGFCTTGTEGLTQSWKNVLIREGDFVEKETKFVEGAPVIYVQLIMILIVVSEKHL